MEANKYLIDEMNETVFQARTLANYVDMPEFAVQKVLDLADRVLYLQAIYLNDDKLKEILRQKMYHSIWVHERNEKWKRCFRGCRLRFAGMPENSYAVVTRVMVDQVSVNLVQGEDAKMVGGIQVDDTITEKNIIIHKSEITELEEVV